MNLYKKFYKTDGGRIFLRTIPPLIIVVLIIAITLFTLNAAIIFLLFPALVLMHIVVAIPPRVVLSRLKATPEKRERVKLLDKGQFTAHNYYSHTRRIYIRRHTVIFQFPDNSRKIFQIDFETDCPLVVNDTGILTYKERNSETLFVSFDADKHVKGGQ